MSVENDASSDKSGRGPRSEFGLAVYFAGLPLCVREGMMLAFINETTDNPDWPQLVFHNIITEGWWRNIAEETPDFTKKMFEYVSI